jgi:hypothetical protein
MKTACWKTKNRGKVISLVTFFLAKQKKVTCCRATPGGVEFEFDFDCWVSLRSTQPTRGFRRY